MILNSILINISMITFIDIFIFLIIVCFITVLIPALVITLIYKKSSKRATKYAMLFVVIFYFSTIAASTYFTLNVPSPNLSKQFTYTGYILGDSDIGGSQNLNFEQANSLHTKMVSYNFTDPLGFLYEDTPHKGFNAKRSLLIVQSHKWNISDYYLDSSQGLKPTLLRINTHLLAFDKKDELRNYALKYLNPQSKNASGILNIDVVNRVPALGETYRELIIRIYDNESINMVLIDLSYDLTTGFSETVNVVYATSEYNVDKPSTVYLETFYTTPEHEMVFLFVLIDIFSFIFLIFSIPAICIKKSTQKKTFYPPFDNYIKRNF